MKGDVAGETVAYLASFVIGAPGAAPNWLWWVGAGEGGERPSSPLALQLKKSVTSSLVITIFGMLKRCRTKRSSWSRRDACVEAVAKRVTLRDNRGIRLNCDAESVFSILGNVIESLTRVSYR